MTTTGERNSADRKIRYGRVNTEYIAGLTVKDIRLGLITGDHKSPTQRDLRVIKAMLAVPLPLAEDVEHIAPADVSRTVHDAVSQVTDVTQRSLAIGVKTLAVLGGIDEEFAGNPAASVDSKSVVDPGSTIYVPVDEVKITEQPFQS